jgi:hypothetical protein
MREIESDAEFDRPVAKMEALDRKENPTPEEEALSQFLMKLTQPNPWKQRKINGGDDGARTRDLRRDRPAF